MKERGKEMRSCPYRYREKSVSARERDRRAWRPNAKVGHQVSGARSHARSLAQPLPGSPQARADKIDLDDARHPGFGSLQRQGEGAGARAQVQDRVGGTDPKGLHLEVHQAPVVARRGHELDSDPTIAPHQVVLPEAP